MDTATSSPAPTRPIFLTLAVCVFTVMTLNSLIIPVLPTIAADLDASRSSINWALTAWLLTAAIATPFFGRVGDIIGRRRTLFIALGALTLGNIVAALAPNLPVFLTGRVLQGMGGALFPLAFGVIRDAFPAKKVPGAIGFISALIGVGGGVGTILAGPIESSLGWRWLFWFPVITLAIATLAAFKFIPESTKRPDERLNLGAAALLGGWLIALLLPVSKGSEWGWASLPVVGLFALAAVLFAAWILVELNSKQPLIDMRMMRLPVVWSVNLVSLLIAGAMFGIFAFLPQFAQLSGSGYGFGLSITESGFLMLPMLGTMAVVGAFSGRIGDAIGLKAQVSSGSLLLAISSTMLVVMHDSITQLVVVGFIFGLGLGVAYAALASLIVQGVEGHQVGAATGMNANVRTIGGALSTAITSALLTSGASSSGVPSEAGFTRGFTFLAALVIVATLASLILPSTKRAVHRSTTVAPSLAVD